jgi:polysaccharide export outer membrane protein
LAADSGPQGRFGDYLTDRVKERGSMRILLALGLLLGCFTAASAQTLRPGDTISISVLQDPKLDRQVLIGPDGMIALPLAGHLKAGGLSPQALEAALKNRLQKNYNDPLDITVALISSGTSADDSKPRIYMTGEILKPGPYVLVQKINLMQAIAQAGGLGPFAARQRIQVRRKIDGAESVYYFDYNAFETGTDLTGNIDLRGGDVIVVPERGLFN